MGKKVFRGFGIVKFLGGLVRWVISQSYKIMVCSVIVVSGLAIQRSIYADPTFGVKFVDIQTTGALSKDKIIQWSGLKAGASTFDVSLHSIERKLLRHSEIKAVRVTRKMPNRIGIFVSERRAFLQVASDEKFKSFWLLDEEGFVIPEVSSTPSSHFPIVVETDLARSPLEIGMQYKDPSYGAAKRLVAAMKDAEFISFEEVAFIRPLEQSEFEIVLKSGIKLFIKEDFETSLKKLDHFRDLLRSDGNTIEYIDLRFSDVAVKKKNGGHGKKE